uniref:KIB1-4 beta-propeller domain-containing protein n=1 Tax=Oryza punctata TaxID=4537 RepID=A0A0E0MP83_ORYPU
MEAQLSPSSRRRCDRHGSQSSTVTCSAPCSSACRPTSTASASAPSAAPGAPALPPLASRCRCRGSPSATGSLIDFDGNPVRCPRPILCDGVVSFHPVGGGDKLVFLEHDDGGCSLMNPLSATSGSSGDRDNPLLPLPKLAAAVRRAVDSCETRTLAAYTPKPSYSTVIMSSSPVVDSSSSPDTLVAALILNRCAVAISTCKRHDDDDDTASFLIRSISLLATTICGIAFLHGKLYAVTSKEGLHVLDLNGGGAVFRSCIADYPEKDSIYKDVERRGHLVVRYLVESGGRLLMVRWWKSLPPPVWNADRPPSRFEVLEAVDLAVAGVGGWWKAVDGLRGRALFLGKADSRSVLAAAVGGGAGAREDCIYFIGRTFWYPSKEEDFGQSGVYDMISGEISPLQLPDRGTVELRLHCEYPRWFFPADY